MWKIYLKTYVKNIWDFQREFILKDIKELENRFLKLFSKTEYHAFGLDGCRLSFCHRAIELVHHYHHSKLISLSLVITASYWTFDSQMPTRCLF